MFANIQISESKFKSIIHDYVQNAVLTNQSLGLDGIRDISFEPLNPDALPEPGVIDHIEIEEISFNYPRVSMTPLDTITINTPPLAGIGGFVPIPQTSTLEIRQLLVLCNISVFCIRVIDLEASGLASASEFVRFDIQAVFNVNQPVIESSRLALRFIPTGINFGLGGIYVAAEDLDNPDVQELAEDLLQIMEDNAEEWFPPIRFPIGNLDEVFGAGLSVWNAGLRVNNGVIDLQLQIGSSDTITWVFDSPIAATWIDQWDNYYSSSINNRLSGLDWGVYFPFELFKRRIAATVETSLEGRDNVVLNAVPTSSWNVTGMPPTGTCFPGGQGNVETHIPVHLPGACIPWDYDMDVNLQLETSISLPRPGVLRLDLVASHEVDPGDVFVCGSLNALLFAGAGVAIGGVFGGWIGAVVGGIIGGLTGGFTTLGIILDQDIPSLTTSSLEAVEGEENTYFIEIEIDPNENEIFGTFSITSVFPCRDGLIAGGSLTESDSTYLPLPTGSLSFPRWRQPGRPECPSDGEDPDVIAEIGFGFYRDASVHAIPLVLWGIKILSEDPTDSWPDPISYLSSDVMAYRYHFTPRELQEIRNNATDGEPNLKILFQTNAGARIFNISVPSDRITEAELTELEDEIVEECTANQDLIDSFEERTRHLRDIIRGPVPYFERVDFDAVRWSVAFAGLPPSTEIELASLIDNQITSLGTIGLNEQGSRRVEFWQSGSFVKTPVLLQLAGPENRERSEEPGFIVISRRYRIMGKISLNGRFQDHALVENKDGVFAAVLTSKGLTSYRLGSKRRLFASHIQSAEGIVGITTFAGKILSKNKSGGVCVANDGKGWQYIPEQASTRVAKFNAGMTKQTPNSRVQSLDYVIPDTSMPATVSQKYALVLSEKGDKLHFMELIDTAVGGYYNPTTTYCYQR